MWTIDIGGSVYPVNFNRVSTELNGHEEAFFTVENNIIRRGLVAQDRDVTIKFLGKQVFFGTLAGVEYTERILKCKVYNKVYNLMNKKEHTQEYADPGTAANTILGNICGEVAGVSAGSCPADAVADIAGRVAWMVQNIWHRRWLKISGLLGEIHLTLELGDQTKGELWYYLYREEQ